MVTKTSENDGMSRLEIFRGRPLARIDRILQELLRIVGPELAHCRVGVDDRIDQSSLLAFDLANIDVADDIAVFVERYRAAHGVDLSRPQRFHERRLVLDLAVDRCESGFEHRTLDISRRGVEAGVVLPFGTESGCEFLVDRIV